MGLTTGLVTMVTLNEEPFKSNLKWRGSQPPAPRQEAGSTAGGPARSITGRRAEPAELSEACMDRNAQPAGERTRGCSRSRSRSCSRLHRSHINMSFPQTHTSRQTSGAVNRNSCFTCFYHIHQETHLRRCEYLLT